MGAVRTKITIEVIDHEATGADVRRTRKAVGLSLRDVADKTGLSTTYLSQLETGHRPWNDNLFDVVMAAITELA